MPIKTHRNLKTQKEPEKTKYLFPIWLITCMFVCELGLNAELRNTINISDKVNEKGVELDTCSDRKVRAIDQKFTPDCLHIYY